MNVNDSIAELLRNHPLFRCLNDEERERIVTDPRCSIATYKGGEAVYTESSFSKALGVVLSGRLLVHRVGNGTAVLLNSIEEGQLFGVASLFTDEQHYVSEITAKTSSEVFFIPSEVIRELLTVNSAFSISYIRFLSDRIRFLNQRLTSLSYGCVEQKLAKYLCDSDGNVATNRKQLASALGIGRASLYRVLDEFVERGYIEHDGKAYRVIDHAALRSLV